MGHSCMMWNSNRTSMIFKTDSPTKDKSLVMVDSGNIVPTKTV